MKQVNTLLLILFVTAFFGACKKELPTRIEYDSYEYERLDENGGEWTPILIPAVTDIPVEAPADITSETYKSELNEVREKISGMTEADRESVKYWGNNPVNRWNEIALELVAKYNLIPGPNADGTYTLPDPENPDGPSPFPFSHPPYAVRALAYLSVAQFDGLITAWHYKFTYNRMSPHVNDAGISPAYVDNNLPSYPSDGAVIAATSREVLTAMFPLEADYLATMEEAHYESLMHSGENVPSDIEAGKKIGEAIAEMALERAANDGMKYAQCSKAASDSIKQAAFDRFGWAWDNLEIPERPVGLTPLFSQVDMWYVENVEDVRPVAPPSPDSPEFAEDVELLKEYANNMTEEYRSIANFWQDGLGTYTPPGHWNRIAKELIVQYKLNPLRTARTYAYLNIAMMDAGISCWDAKYYYHYPRPIQLIDDFETIAGTPNFPSYTSGHSVFSAAGAEILAYIFPAEAGQMNAWAEEAAISRVYGGIHWSFDATVGTDQGRNVASYTLEHAYGDGAD